MAYKPDVHDTRESPSLEIMRRLIARGGDVRYCDPWVDELELDGELHRSVEWTPEELAAADCVVVLTAHRRSSTEPLLAPGPAASSIRATWCPPGARVSSI